MGTRCGVVQSIGAFQPAARGKSDASPIGSVEHIAANDNRTVVGALADGTLTVRLEARLGEWHSDGDDKPGVVVKAFSAEGGSLLVPSPLIRVRQGTTIHASVRNSTDEPLVVHGLYSRPASEADAARVLMVAPGQTQDVSFLAGTPGIYEYWGARDAMATIPQRRSPDTQLSGALVVDPDGSRPQDRVMVITTWTNDYFDGVPGFAGEGKRLAPAIAPGKTFDARFTPPRSGTFIYHTHFDDLRQQRADLSGTLLVVNDPATYDPVHDRVILVTVPRKTADAAKVLLNGTLVPEAREMRVGERYRLRFINVHTNRPNMRMRLLKGEDLLRWRFVAKDGMDLPLDQLRDSTAEIQMGNGETCDVELQPMVTGDIRVDVTTGNLVLLNSMPIHAR